MKYNTMKLAGSTAGMFGLFFATLFADSKGLAYLQSSYIMLFLMIIFTQAAVERNKSEPIHHPTLLTDHPQRATNINVEHNLLSDISIEQNIYPSQLLPGQIDPYAPIEDIDSKTSSNPFNFG